MTEPASTPEPSNTTVAEPVIRQRGGFPLVWLIPLVAVAVAGWLLYQSIAETGPLATVSFKNASGVEAGKTRVRIKDVVVGMVETVSLSPDLSRVLVGIRMNPSSGRLLTSKANWWMVKPRITAREISGLSTLLSGTHIEMDPGNPKTGKPQKKFTGREDPPLIGSDEPGSEFHLHAETLGSVGVGSPIYFRRIAVGYVTKTKLQDDGDAVDIDIFIQAPYDKQVRTNSHFWNASGVDIQVGADGFRLRSQSLTSILSGGIAFDVPDNRTRDKRAPAGKTFTLFDDEQDGDQNLYAWNLRYLAYFGGSVRGLSPDAPVEFRGVKVGSVEHIYLEEDPNGGNLRIAVQLNIQPERVTTKEDNNRGAATEIAELVRHGLRAQLRTGSLLTGQRFIELDMHPDAEPATIITGGKYPILPTVPETLEAITARITSLLDTVDKLPLAEIAEELKGSLAGVNMLVNSPELKQAVAHLNNSMGELQTLGEQLNQRVLPDARGTLKQASATLKTAQSLIGPGSPLHHELLKALKDLSAAARSIRVMAQYLERHPDSLLRGKSSRR